MQPAVSAVRVARVDQLVRGDRGAHPRARLAAVVELDPLVEPIAERVDAELAVRADVGGEEVDVVEALDRAAAAGVAARHVLQRRPQMRGRLVALALVVELEDMPVRVPEAIRRPASKVAVRPALTESGRLDGR